MATGESHDESRIQVRSREAVAVFDDHDELVAAIQELEMAGFNRSQMNLLASRHGARRGYRSRGRRGRYRRRGRHLVGQPHRHRPGTGGRGAHRARRAAALGRHPERRAGTASDRDPPAALEAGRPGARTDATMEGRAGAAARLAAGPLPEAMRLPQADEATVNRMDRDMEAGSMTCD